MGGGSASPQTSNTKATQAQLNLNSASQGQSQLQNSGLVGQVASGQMSVQDAINAIQNNSSMGQGGTYTVPQYPTNGTPQEKAAWAADVAKNVEGLGIKGATATQGDVFQGASKGDVINSLLSDPALINQVGDYEALQSPSLAGFYGKGGQMEQAQNAYTEATKNLGSDYEALKGRDQSYGLTPQDLMAYNQAAGNIARQFGSQSQGLSQMLANQGLSEGGSGSANQAFSNVFGNQAEQLAGLQSQIALNRINTAQQLAQARVNTDLAEQGQSSGYATNLASIGQNAKQNAVNNILNAKNTNYNVNAGTAGVNMQNQGLQQSIADTQWQQQQASNPMNIIGGILGGALSAGVGSLGGAIGKSLGGAIGGGGSGTAGLSMPSMGSQFAGTSPSLGVNTKL